MLWGWVTCKGSPDGSASSFCSEQFYCYCTATQVLFFLLPAVFLPYQPGLPLPATKSKIRLHRHRHPTFCLSFSYEGNYTILAVQSTSLHVLALEIVICGHGSNTFNGDGTFGPYGFIFIFLVGDCRNLCAHHDAVSNRIQYMILICRWE